MSLSSVPAAPVVAQKNQHKVCGENSGRICVRTRNFSETNNSRNSRVNLLKGLITKYIVNLALVPRRISNPSP